MNDLKREQDEAERKARESEKAGQSPDYPNRPKPERGPDPTPPADGVAQVENMDPTPGGRAPAPAPDPDGPKVSPNPQPRNTIPPNPGSDKGGGVSA